MRTAFEEMIERIQKAEVEAIQKGIRTNTIVLNNNFAFCKEFYAQLVNNAKDVIKTMHFPPCILDKSVIRADWLPDEYTFALTETNTTNVNDYINGLKEQIKLLKKYVKIIGEGDNEQLVDKLLISE